MHTPVHILSYEWDKNKNAINIHKHGIAFSEVTTVFEDPLALTIDQTVDSELRHVTVGMDDLERILVIVYTLRQRRIRIMSARKANRWERTQYGI